MEEKGIIFGVRRYSEALKHLICKEHIQEGIGLNELKRKYNLSSHSLIHEWLRKLKYLPAKFKNDRNIVEIGIENYQQVHAMPLPQSEPCIGSESGSSIENSEIKRLKKELLEAQMKAEA
jgi:hypothetical protein